MTALDGLPSAVPYGSSVWPPPPREPLPTDPPITGEQPGPPQASCWAREPYARRLPATVPQMPTRTFHRGSVFMRVPGLDEGEPDSLWRRGIACPDFDCSWSWPKYRDENMRRCVDFRALCGHTQVSLSILHAWNQHGRDWPAAFAALRRVEAYVRPRVPFISWNIASGEDETFATTRAFADQLVAAGVIKAGIDLIVTCWQIDKWHTPASGIDEIVAVGTWGQPYGLLNFSHWGGGYGGWADNCAMWDDDTEARWGIHDRASFQRVLGPGGMNVLKGHYGQCNVEADLGQVQSWIRKITQVFPLGMVFVAAEMDMQARSDDPYGRLDLYSDQKAYFAQCSVTGLYDVEVSSFDGSRGRDGRVLLPEAF